MFTEERFKFEGFSGCFGCRGSIHKRATATGGTSAQKTAIARIYAQIQLPSVSCISAPSHTRQVRHELLYQLLQADVIITCTHRILPLLPIGDLQHRLPKVLSLEHAQVARCRILHPYRHALLRSNISFLQPNAHRREEFTHLWTNKLGVQDDEPLDRKPLKEDVHPVLESILLRLR